MKEAKLTVHTLVKNEGNFIWYAVNSVIDYAEKIIVWDTGSKDKTMEIVKKINNPKIEVEEKGERTAEELAILRNEMIEKTDTEWFLLLDGDEIWSRQGIEEILDIIGTKGDQIEAVVSPVKMLVGDIYHYQEERAGRYEIAGKKGHYNIRAIKKTKGLHLEGSYPNEAYVNDGGVKIQGLSKEKLYFAKTPYLHLSHLKRSSLENKKYKYELGKHFPLDYYYPETFFENKPAKVPTVFEHFSKKYLFRSFLITPLKQIKRRVFN